MKKAAWFAALAALALATAFSCSPMAQAPSSPQFHQSSSESRRLKDIFENYFEAYLELFPLYATQIGDHRYDHRLAINIDAQHRASFIKKLSTNWRPSTAARWRRPNSCFMKSSTAHFDCAWKPAASRPICCRCANWAAW